MRVATILLTPAPLWARYNVSVIAAGFLLVVWLLRCRLLLVC